MNHQPQRRAIPLGVGIGALGFGWWLANTTTQDFASLSSAQLPNLLQFLVQCACVAVCGWVAMVCLIGPWNFRLVRLLAPRWSLPLIIAIFGFTPTAANADTSLDGLRLPDRTSFSAPPPPVAPASSAVSSTRTTSSEPVDQVVVVAGDSLWSLAQRQLPTGSSPQQIATAVTKWHELNRSTIGDNPDLIYPGQTLNVPKVDLP